ncbi:MAG: c-type cytochrome [Halomonas sp.]|uniref:c-type cytochrome n=1 Tax=Halomonas sp. TaxID=1486246 RepID=UPI003F9283BB
MRHDVDRDLVYKTVKEVVIVKSSKLIIGCVAALALGAGAAVAQENAEDAAIAKRLAPVGELCLQGEDCGSAAAAPAVASSSSGGSADGQAIYNSVCMVCHDAGVAGAPIHGDEAAWADRVTKGFDTLLDHSVNGFNAMPARGGNPNLSDEEMLAATKYMLEPVMDVPADEAPAADDASEDAAADEAAADDDAATAEGEEQVAATDSSGNTDTAQQDKAQQDEAQQEAAQDSSETAAATEVAAAEEPVGADLPGASKITVCVACHGQDGHGTAPIYPNLAGQNATYLESSMKAYRAGERAGGMSSVMTPMAASLSDEDIVDIAEYYSQQPR